MISVSGIKYQNEIEQLPYFNKNEASVLIGKKAKNLDKKIERLTKSGYLMSLKKGMYVSSAFYEKTDKAEYSEFMANKLREPSYLSLEYVLAQGGIIPEAVYSFTSITLKTTRLYSNFLGNFNYKNINNNLFTGYGEKQWQTYTIKIATTAKALFDFLYLKQMDNMEQELVSDLRINWNNFSKGDLSEFAKYVELSPSIKMSKILEIIKTIC